MGKGWYVLLVLIAGSSYGVVSTLMKVGYARGLSVSQATNMQYMAAVVVLWVLVGISWWKNPNRTAVSSVQQSGHSGSSGSSGSSVSPMSPNKPSIVWPAGKQWIVILILAISAAGTSYTYYLALSHLPASLGIVLLFQFAWMVMLMDIVATKRLPSGEKWLGMALIIAGTLLAVGIFEQSLGIFPWWAFALGLVAALCYATTLYASAYVNPQVSPVLRSALTISISLLLIFCVFPPMSSFSAHLWTWMGWWGFSVGMFSQVIPLFLMMVAIPRIGGRMAGVLGSIELPVAVFVAWLAIGESVSLLRWIGVFLILFGIGISELPLHRFKNRMSNRNNLQQKKV